jgi:hypothetical protein
VIEQVPFIIHWLQDDLVSTGKAIVACGTEAEAAYLYSIHKVYRDVYITLSVELLNCDGCILAVQFVQFAKYTQF